MQIAIPTIDLADVRYQIWNQLNDGENIIVWKASSYDALFQRVNYIKNVVSNSSCNRDSFYRRGENSKDGISPYSVRSTSPTAIYLYRGTTRMVV